MALAWKDLAPVVSGMAPTLGGLLGGLIPFPGGAMLGEAAGRMLAGALGVPATPDSVNDAIQTRDPATVQAALTTAEQEAVAKWQALTSMVQADVDLGKTQVVATAGVMEAELQLANLATGWVRNAIALAQSLWRPAAMYLWILTWVWQLYYIFYVVPTDWQPSALYALTAWNTGPAALAGIYSIGRSLEKVREVAEKVGPIKAPAVVTVKNAVRKMIVK